MCLVFPDPTDICVQLTSIHLLGSLGIMEADGSGMGEREKRREARDGKHQ